MKKIFKILVETACHAVRIKQAPGSAARCPYLVSAVILLFCLTAQAQFHITVLADTNGNLVAPTNFFAQNSNLLNQAVAAGSGGALPYYVLTNFEIPGVTLEGGLTNLGVFVSDEGLFVSDGSGNVTVSSSLTIKSGTGKFYFTGPGLAYTNSSSATMAYDLPGTGQMLTESFNFGGGEVFSRRVSKTDFVLYDDVLASAIADANTNGTTTFFAVAGAGSGLTGLNASALASGTIPYGTLSGVSGSGTGTILSNTGSAIVWAASPSGGGGGSPTFNSSQFSSSGGTTNIVQAGITNNGVNLTNLNASGLASGTVPTARLGSGTANVGAALMGNSAWAVMTNLTAGNGLSIVSGIVSLLQLTSMQTNLGTSAFDWTFAHGLGATPSRGRLVLLCINSDATSGLKQGDEYDMGGVTVNSSTGVAQTGWHMNSTNCVVHWLPLSGGTFQNLIVNSAKVGITTTNFALKLYYGL